MMAERSRWTTIVSGNKVDNTEQALDINDEQDMNDHTTGGVFVQKLPLLGTSVQFHDYLGPVDAASIICVTACTEETGDDIECQTIPALFDQPAKDQSIQAACRTINRDEKLVKDRLTKAACRTIRTGSVKHGGRIVKDRLTQVARRTVPPCLDLLWDGKSDKGHATKAGNVPGLRYEHIADNDETVQLYTGLPNAATFELIFEKISVTYERRYNIRRGPLFTLKPIDQMLLTLMRLRLGLVIVDLGSKFQICNLTCIRILKKWIDLFYQELGFLIHWPSREDINNTMPSDFREKYPNTRVIIDCTEIDTESPRSSVGKTLKWKSLIGVTPSGEISFVSDLWPDSISDEQVVDKSGILDWCEQDDAIMFNEGFLIQDMNTTRGMNSRVWTSIKDISSTRDFENFRIHVDRHIARVKTFKLFQKVPSKMEVSMVSKIWKVCNYFTAFFPPTE